MAIYYSHDCGMSKLQAPPDGPRRLAHCGQKPPGVHTPHRHHLPEAHGQQRAISRETAVGWSQAMVAAHKVT